MRDIVFVRDIKFVDKHGEVVVRLKSIKPQNRVRNPLIGFGDKISVGDLIKIALYQNGKFAEIEFDGKPVRVLDYDDNVNHLILVETENGQALVHCFGNEFQREFKKVENANQN